MEQYFSIQEAAQYLDVDYKVVYRLVREGKIRSTRIGWQFRITQDDLNAYLNAERAKQESTAQQLRGQAPAAALQLAAGQAERAVRPSQAAGVALCIPPAERLRARQLEQNFIGRFQTQIAEIESLRHPTTGALIAMADWQMDLFVGEDRDGLMRALNSAFLDRKTLTTTPHNTFCRCTVAAEPPFVLEARFFAHLPALCSDGVDPYPANVDDLRSLIQLYTQKAGVPDRAVIAGIASPSGWDEAARRVVGEPEGEQWAVRGVHILLIDLQSNSIHHGPQDTVAAGFAGLYQSAIDLEDMAVLREKLLSGLEGRSGLLLAEAAQAWGVERATLEDAASSLVADGGVRLVPDRNNSWILVRV
jgi:excisionase family DNA binding protein